MVMERDWLYVLDHCKGIDLVYHTGKEANVYNIGGRNERTNLQIVDEKVPAKNSYNFRRRYAIDATKLETELGWKADSGIVKTVDWYLVKYLEKR